MIDQATQLAIAIDRQRDPQQRRMTAHHVLTHRPDGRPETRAGRLKAARRLNELEYGPDGHPVIEAHIVDGSFVTPRCPICAASHSHGSSDGLHVGDEVFRVAHCTSSAPSGYPGRVFDTYRVRIIE